MKSSLARIAQLCFQWPGGQRTGSRRQAQAPRHAQALHPTPDTRYPIRRYLLLVAALLCLTIFTGYRLASVSAQDQGTGLTTLFQHQNGQQILVIDSPGRFELQLDASGIVAWYNLQRDPQRQVNLVQSGAHLLEHRLATAGTLLNGPFTLREQTPVRARVHWQGHIGTPTQPFDLDYTIWAGGQVAVTLRTPAGVTTQLQRDPDAITGAALQPQAATVDTSGTRTQSFMLFLDAWTGEDTSLQHQGAQPIIPNTVFDPQSGALQAQATPGQSLRLRLPPGIGRQPRFEIAGWPAADLTVRRGDKLLVAGQDYLANWNPTTHRLTLQYLHLLPMSDRSDEREFELTAAPAAPSLALSITGKNLDESGFLIVDGNMPDINGTPSISDTFKIPYIQTSPQLAVTATTQSAPSGSGVEFVLDNSQSQQDYSSPFEATFTLATMGNHRLDAYIINRAGNRLASASINPLGYGVILDSIGDSITVGKYGDYIKAGEPGFPVTSYQNQSAGKYSDDGRNVYQYDNYSANGATTYYYRGYQVDLNNLLTTGADIPVFILNDGVSGLRTTTRPDQLPGKSSLNKVSAYNDHIAKLGVQHVLLELGTNDAADNRQPSDWETGMNTLIDDLQTPNKGLSIWLARIPWRGDNPNFDALDVKYNALMPDIVSSQTSAANPVYLGPDFYTFFKNHPDQISSVNPDDPSEPDNVHPTPEGLVSMATLWSESLVPVLTASTGIGTPTPTSTPPSKYELHLPVVAR